MHSSSATVRNNPATRKAVVMALIGIGLLAYVFAGWMQPVPEGSTAVDSYVAPASEAVTHLPSGGAAAAAMAVGFTRR